MGKLIKEDIARAKTFLGSFWFIVHLCALNDGEDFQKSRIEIYPKEMMLRLEYSGFQATFLDLNIR